MSKSRRGKTTGQPDEPRGAGRALPRRYRRAREAAEAGRHEPARAQYEYLLEVAQEPWLRALARSDLATLDALEGRTDAAIDGFRAALAIDTGCDPARLNLALLQAERACVGPRPPTDAESKSDADRPPTSPAPDADRVRVALVSLLFNWPSTGGGTVHTYELAAFLRRAGYEVLHVYVRHDPWGLGQVEGHLPYPSRALEFDAAHWDVPAIQGAICDAVAAFEPDTVIVTDSWNSKPLLAEAVRDYPYLLRLQAMECLCPLNNVRLLSDGAGGFAQCALDQLSQPEACAACLERHGPHSGALHQAERALCGVGTAAYHERLLRAIREARAVLVVNPLTEALVRPFAPDVRVITAGMDPDRFPWPAADEPAEAPETEPGRRLRLLFAGLVDEPMKGFAVLHEACALLWRHRRDFELLATADPPGPADAFTHLVGWQSQEALPRLMRDCDVVVVPTVAQEALGRTAVEAMAAGRPVVASRLGGLPVTVVEGETGLLCVPGDPVDLARALERLLDDPALRRRLGRAGRARFEAHYAWPVIIERHYRPLLVRRDRTGHVSAPAAARHRPDASPVPYTPHIPSAVDERRWLAEAEEFFGRDPAELADRYREYREFSEAEDYARTLGERKTLCLEEAFLLERLLADVRPRRIAEVGVQHGRSTRRLLDSLRRLGLDSQLVGFDLTDERRHVGPREMSLVLGDLTGRFAERVLDAHRPDVVFLDVHTYPLLKEALAACLGPGGPRALALHDCGPGLCNPRMTLTRDDPAVTSATGVWERHVLAEHFGLDDPLDPRLDDRSDATHRLRIFTTPHGLALIVPRSE